MNFIENKYFLKVPKHAHKNSYEGIARPDPRIFEKLILQDKTKDVFIKHLEEKCDVQNYWILPKVTYGDI